jgi:CHAT domain-containing protein
MDAEGAGFSRLLYSRTEAGKILALVGDAQQRLAALDFAANRETATGAEIAKYRYLHFATHGLLNESHPELSGIVLSLVDEQGQPRDGFLKLSEIYNLKLSADLVVLSACQTALGKQVKAEGIIGLTRGFMYAGAPRVVASLWKVQDDATAELMANFYRAMLREGKRPAEAMRVAQVAMLNKRNWRSPFYWAAFVLQGDWQ